MHSLMLLVGAGQGTQEEIEGILAPYEQEDDEENINPDGRFDYFSIGGRFCDYLMVKEGCTGIKGEFPWGEDKKIKEEIENNPRKFSVCKFGDIDWGAMRDELPYAIFLDEEWYTEDDGWDLDWSEVFKELLKGIDPDIMVAIIDYHYIGA